MDSCDIKLLSIAVDPQVTVSYWSYSKPKFPGKMKDSGNEIGYLVKSTVLDGYIMALHHLYPLSIRILLDGLL